MSVSDRIAIMNHGRIDQVGGPGEVYERPANPFVGGFLGEANLIEGTVMAQAGEVMRLRLPSGEELRATRSNGCVTGRGMLFIRPERVEIAPGAAAFGDPGANALAGKVRPARFSALSCDMPWTSTALRRSQSICRTRPASRYCPQARRLCCAGRSRTV